MQSAIYMFMSALFFAGMGVAVKTLSHFPFYELVLFRSLIILAICVPQIIALRGSLFGRPENRKLLFARGLFGTAGLTLYFLTLQKLDFGTAVTIQYTSPIFTVLIATYFLGEQRSAGVLLWMLVAFLGVATIYRFDLGEGGFWLVVLGLIAAFFSGCAYNCISQLKDRENPQVIMMFFPLVTIPMVAVPSALDFLVPGFQDSLLIVGMGVCTYFAQFFLTKAYQSAPASRVAVYGNLNVVLALIVGWLIFQESPDLFKLVGAGLILVSVFAVQNLQQNGVQGSKTKFLMLAKK